jgi:cation diffusion facilitator CzcD-associated flavoprotein CzcO
MKLQPMKNGLRFFRGTPSVDVVIVGAGPYGLSIAAHLLDAKIDALVCGEPMAGWRYHMPRGMYLKSTFDASSLSAPTPGSSLADYCAASGIPIPDEFHPVSLDMFVDYGLWFQKRQIAELARVEVQSVAAVAGGFRVALSGGEEIVARTVIVASGHVRYAYMPSQLRSLAAGDAGRVSHASRHVDLSEFAGRSVAIIGAGQSALESAVLLREAGAEVHLLVRRPNLVWGNPPVNPSGSLLRSMLKPESPLGPGWSLFMLSRAPELVAFLPKAARLFLTRTVLGPSGAWWLRNRLDQKINVSLETVVEEAALSNDKVVLQLRTRAGRTSALAVDHVIAATGYRIDLDALPFLDPALRAGIARIPGTSAPRLTRSFESSVGGLYLTGLTAAPTFGTLMRFVCGTEFTARTIRRALAG